MVLEGCRGSQRVSECFRESQRVSERNRESKKCLRESYKVHKSSKEFLLFLRRAKESPAAPLPIMSTSQLKSVDIVNLPDNCGSVILQYSNSFLWLLRMLTNKSFNRRRNNNTIVIRVVRIINKI